MCNNGDICAMKQAHIAKIESQNAQLKEANQTLAAMNESMWVELEMKRTESQGIMHRLHQLIKAKEIIENLIDALETIDGEQVRELTEVKEAERFLSEVEE